MKIIVQYDDKTISPSIGKSVYETELYADVTIENEHGGKRLRLDLHPKQSVRIEKIQIIIPYVFAPNERLFCNGFQSWTESREFRLDEPLRGLKTIARPLMKFYGDYHFPNVRYRKGHHHSWTYAYIRKSYRTLWFVGSLNEATGYTLIQFDQATQSVIVEKDCAGLTLEHSYCALDIFLMEGDDKLVFDAYFKTMQLPPLRAKKTVGWTSWYHYYTNISEKIILENLRTFTAQLPPQKEAPFFQIDDGYQTQVGDWLDIKPSFPNGMASIATAIHQQGCRAGLWLAPFVCDGGSKIFKHKKHWLLCDKKGKPVRAGYNPLWGGWFYVLDFYNDEVRDYLSGVFYTVLQKWGFDLLKLDFLYAVALLPMPNKTRGHIMYEAMQFLRQIVGNEKLILGCGVPLGAAFGLVDYCRIGADIHLSWEHRLLKTLGNRERVSTLLALRSVFGRWQLDGRAFLNDPDVFLLRKEKNKLSPQERECILNVNALLGSLLFTSDFLDNYDQTQLASFQTIFEKMRAKVDYVEQQDDLYKVYFKNEGAAFIAVVNLNNARQQTIINGAPTWVDAHTSLLVTDASKRNIWENPVL